MDNMELLKLAKKYEK